MRLIGSGSNGLIGSVSNGLIGAGAIRSLDPDSSKPESKYIESLNPDTLD